MAYRFGRVTACLGLALVAGCPNQGVPEPDSCATPQASAVDSVELGAPTPTTLFAAWADGDVVPRVFGSQGGAMLLSRVRVRGASMDCMAQQTRVLGPDGYAVAQVDVPLRVYVQSDGSMLTNDYWIVLEGRAPSQSLATVETEVGGVVAARTVWMDQVYSGPQIAALEPATLEIVVGETAQIEVRLTAPVTAYSLDAIVSVSNKDVAELGSRVTSVREGQSVGVVSVTGKAAGDAELTVFLGQQKVTAAVSVGTAL